MPVLTNAASALLRCFSHGLIHDEASCTTNAELGAMMNTDFSIDYILSLPSKKERPPVPTLNVFHPVSNNLLQSSFLYFPLSNQFNSTSTSTRLYPLPYSTFYPHLTLVSSNSTSTHSPSRHFSRFTATQQSTAQDTLRASPYRRLTSINESQGTGLTLSWNATKYSPIQSARLVSKRLSCNRGKPSGSRPSLEHFVQGLVEAGPSEEGIASYVQQVYNENRFPAFTSLCGWDGTKRLWYNRHSNSVSLRMQLNSSAILGLVVICLLTNPESPILGDIREKIKDLNPVELKEGYDHLRRRCCLGGTFAQGKTVQVVEQVAQFFGVSDSYKENPTMGLPSMT